MAQSSGDSGDIFVPVRAVFLPATDCDVLTGLAQIAAWMGLSPGQCRQRVDSGVIPTFRVGGKPTVYALKSQINAAAADYAARRISSPSKRAGPSPE